MSDGFRLLSTAQRWSLAGAALAFFLSGCGGSGEDAAESSKAPTTEVASDQPAETAPTSEAPQPDPPSDASVPTTAAEQSSSESATTTVLELGPIDNVLPVLATNPTEAGPRPLLSWTAVSGATQYELTVLNAAGEPYWSWSGAESEVFLGGMEEPDAIGAWVFEELTWVVTARDADGATLALSDRATLKP